MERVTSIVCAIIICVNVTMRYLRLTSKFLWTESCLNETVITIIIMAVPVFVLFFSFVYSLAMQQYYRRTTKVICFPLLRLALYRGEKQNKNKISGIQHIADTHYAPKAQAKTSPGQIQKLIPAVNRICFLVVACRACKYRDCAIGSSDRKTLFIEQYTHTRIPSHTHLHAICFRRRRNNIAQNCSFCILEHIENEKRKCSSWNSCCVDGTGEMRGIKKTIMVMIMTGQQRKIDWFLSTIILISLIRFLRIHSHHRRHHRYHHHHQYQWPYDLLFKPISDAKCGWIQRVYLLPVVFVHTKEWILKQKHRENENTMRNREMNSKRAVK